MKGLELLEVVDVSNTLGECVLWNDRQQTVWWTDIHESGLFCYDYSRRSLVTHVLPDRLASFGFTEDDRVLVCAFASGFALFEPATGNIKWLSRPNAGTAGIRFNDGRVDRQGRFWAGTMVEQAAAVEPGSGNLYRLTGGACQKVLEGISISNSLCWSRDSRTLYFADSPTHTISAYEFDASSGEPSDSKVFARITAPYEPDGSTIDSEGFLWNAQWGAGRVVRYAPDGTPAGELLLPVSQPTCVAFGGNEMKTLFVTTANVGLDSDQLLRQPQAGNLLIYQTPYTGLPESRFKLHDLQP